MQKISKPGAYEMLLADYLSDCCAGPSISSSGLRMLIQTCPAKFKESIKKTTSGMNLGSAAHLHFLEPHEFERRIAISPYEEYRSNEAKEWRDHKILTGIIPFKPKEFEAVKSMRDAFHKSRCASFFKGGNAEQSVIWKDEETGIWCKTRPDYVNEGMRKAYEYKTTTSVRPEDFMRTSYDQGYFMQCAWHLEGLKAIGSDIRDVAIIAQETEAPFLSQEFPLDEEYIENGAKLNRAALRIYADCLATGDWYGYRSFSTPDKDGPITLHPPHWALSRIEEAVAYAPKLKPARGENPDPGNPMMIC